jgi:hypothetical protein
MLQKIVSEFVEAETLSFRAFSSPYKRMSSIDALSLRIPVRCPTLIGVVLPLTTLVGITRKRKKLLTRTQETTRAKLE